MSQTSTTNPGLEHFDGAAAIIPAAEIQFPRSALLALLVLAFGSGIPLLLSP
jgi:hypothetical protein